MSLKLAYHQGSITRGNKYKLGNRFHYDLWKRYFSAGKNTVKLFKACLDRFWANQDIIYDFTTDLTGIEDR